METRVMQSWILRPPKPGDIGWVIERHGTLYAIEYGFGPPFEAEVAQVASPPPAPYRAVLFHGRERER